MFFILTMHSMDSTIILSLMQGLVNVVQEVLPSSKHHWCARHIFANWSKKWHGGEMKKKFWLCAGSTFPEEFEDNLQKLGEVGEKAAEDLLKYPPHT